MATYTQNYTLHQWEDSDDFLRTDFNTDFAKIDTALGRAERSATSNAYNIYNLILQNYYESKYTGYKSALLFDGFMDDSQISALTDGAWWDEDNQRIEVVTDGAEDVTPTYLINAGVDFWTGNVSGCYTTIGQYGLYQLDTTFTPSGFGTLNSVSLRMASKNTAISVELQVQILSGTEVLGTSDTFTLSVTTFDDHTFTFSDGVALTARETYTLRLLDVNQADSAYICLEGTSYGNYFSVAYDYTPAYHTTGDVISLTEALSSNCTQINLWARHSDGAVTAQLSVGGTLYQMTPVSTTVATTLQGTPCYETAFTLSQSISSDVQVGATLSLAVEEETLYLYDYGIIFL